MEALINKIDWSLLERLKLLEKNEAISLLKIADIDPSSTVTKMRSIIERIIRYLYSNNFQDDNYVTFEQMNKRLQEKEFLPKFINIYINTIRISGNVAVHDRVDSKEDVHVLLPLFAHVIEWFVNQLMKKTPPEELNKIHYGIFKDLVIVQDELDALREIETEIDQTIQLYQPNKGKISGEDIKRPLITIDKRHVVFLDLHGIGLSVLPEAIRRLKYLRKLNIEKNHIAPIPGWIASMDSLKELVVDPGLITKVKEVIKLKPGFSGRVYSPILENLQDNVHTCGWCFFIILIIVFLSIFYNALSIETQHLMDVAIGVSITYLFVSFVMIAFFGAITLSYEKISKYRVTRNPVKKLDLATLRLLESVKQNGTIKYKLVDDRVVAFHMSGTKWTEIPPMVRAFKSIKDLYLRNNEIQQIPDWICEFQDLERIELLKNPITSVSDKLLELPHLSWLRISKRLKANAVIKSLKQRKVHVIHNSRLLVVCAVELLGMIPAILMANAGDLVLIMYSSIFSCALGAYATVNLIWKINMDVHVVSI